jgi:REP element-mobilizing transposase RayT
MAYDPQRHHRRSIRLTGYDYALPGAYFVTICTKNRVCFFGDVVEGRVQPSPIGAAAQACWAEIPDHFPQVALDAFVVMPNHVHGIIGITNRADGDHSGTQPVDHTTDDAGTRDGDGLMVDPGTSGAVQLNGPTSEDPPTGLTIPTSKDQPKGPPSPTSEDPPTGPTVDPYFSNLSPKRGTLSVIIRTYKAAVTRWCRVNGYPAFAWQSRFYDHIIRNDKALTRIRRYIADNPRRWSTDREHPTRGT